MRGWSKYAEEIAGRSYLQQGDTATFSNYAFDDVYDTYQYLSAPGASPLLDPVRPGHACGNRSELAVRALPRGSVR